MFEFLVCFFPAVSLEIIQFPFLCLVSVMSLFVNLYNGKGNLSQRSVLLEMDAVGVIMLSEIIWSQ